MRKALVTTVLALAMTAAGCSASSSPHRAATAAGARTVALTGNDLFRFGPMSVTAPAGPVVVVFTGLGSYPHDIHFTTLGRTSASTSGGLTGNRVTLDLGTLKPGTYPFVCDYHYGAGMKGVLTIR